jgi:hypothetical protein
MFEVSLIAPGLLCARLLTISQASWGWCDREPTMKRFASIAFLLACGIAAATPALADFAVVRYDSGYCQVWWDSADNPWGSGWSKIALGLPDAAAAHAVLDNAVLQNVCR